jgi:hypothetical protein
LLVDIIKAINESLILMMSLAVSPKVYPLFLQGNILIGGLERSA